MSNNSILAVIFDTFYLLSFFVLAFSLISLVIYFFTNDYRDSFSSILFLSLFFLLAIPKKFLSDRGIKQLDKRDAIIVTSIVWILIPIVFSIPYLFNGLSIVDSIFESVSAVTTTGFTFFSPKALDSLPLSIILWRSFEQWIGGIGIIIFLTLIIPPQFTAFLLKGEGRDELLEFSFTDSAKLLIKLYVILTFIVLALYSFTGLDFFTSLNLAFTTLATGGMTPSSNVNHNIYSKIMTIVGMVIGSTSFRIFYELNKKGIKALEKYLETLIFYHLIVLIPTMIFFVLFPKFSPIHYLFHSYSAISGTGYSLDNLNAYPKAYILYLITLMVIGGMLGSTAGGIKIDRFILILKNIVLKLKELIYPKEFLFVIKYQGKIVEKEEIYFILTFFSIYILTLSISSLLFSLYTHNLTYALFEMASALGNVGLSLGYINRSMPLLYKLLTIIVMYLGRLEIIVPLAMFYYGYLKIKKEI